ncbi:hypothetical protein CTI12_AA501840 [Artemisia annua]|uniref:Replication protein A OB domain-containing protein n=1 Tax=Artemisia annua TaxID=35608 RepID=A0A2U1LD65_ARTAN|nr:hypothetical protein CTI12_AA501840 [Artemisia annua]
MRVPDLIPTWFSCILLDKKGTTMQANADLKEKERFEHYIGYIHNVEKVKEYGGATGNKVKLRNISIRNLNNNVVTFTLWNQKADNFEEDEYLKMTKPVVLAVSSCYLKTYAGQLQLSATSATSYYFNPPIEETAKLLAAHNESGATIPQLEIQTEKLSDWEQERTRNRVALGTLLQIDPNTQQRVLFTQQVMILRIDQTHEWYYQKCDECGGKLNYGFVHGHCHPYGTQPKPEKSYSFRLVMTDGTGNAVISCYSPQTDGLIKDVNTLLEEVADTSPEIIPPQILALENTRHVFQFRFAKPVAKGPPTFVLQKVMDHAPSILPPSTERPSSPLSASTYDESAAHLSPPPATPSATQETPTDMLAITHLRSSSSVRKELFTTSAEEESDPESKKQKTE